MPELSAPLTQQLSHVLDCTVTLRRGVDDRSTEVTIMVTTAWDAADVDHADRGLLAPQVRGEPDEEGWLNAQVAALHGYLFDLSEPDVMDQADEISALCVAIIARLHPDGDTVLALETADWFPPFDSVALVRAGLNVIDRAVSRLCDRMAYALGDHLRLVETDDCEPPAVEHPQSWWLVTSSWSDPATHDDPPTASGHGRHRHSTTPRGYGAGLRLSPQHHAAITGTRPGRR